MLSGFPGEKIPGNFPFSLDFRRTWRENFSLTTQISGWWGQKAAVTQLRVTAAELPGTAALLSPVAGPARVRVPRGAEPAPRLRSGPTARRARPHPGRGRPAGAVPPVGRVLSGAAARSSALGGPGPSRPLGPAARRRSAVPARRGECLRAAGAQAQAAPYCRC